MILPVARYGRVGSPILTAIRCRFISSTVSVGKVPFTSNLRRKPAAASVQPRRTAIMISSLVQGGRHLMSADLASHSDHHIASTKNDRVRYGTVAMAFHWTIATLVLANIALGIWFVNFIDRT